jgi:catechol 2,3-dioxygenase-like lactoylglutathione lyase family enzyme
VLHVASVEASLRFYVDRLGFTVSWRFEEDGRVRVAQVDRQNCALILSDQWPDKIGKGLMFISLNVEPETREAEAAALDSLRAEIEARGVSVQNGFWGYRLLVVEDLDGNQLFFNTICRNTVGSARRGSSAIAATRLCPTNHPAARRPPRQRPRSSRLVGF